MSEIVICPINGDPCKLRPIIAEQVEYWDARERKISANIQAFKEARVLSVRGIIYALIMITGHTFPDVELLPSIQKTQEMYAAMLATTCVDGICNVRQRLIREFGSAE